jgi:hypothetical protein
MVGLLVCLLVRDGSKVGHTKAVTSAADASLASQNRPFVLTGIQID